MKQVFLFMMFFLLFYQASNASVVLTNNGTSNTICVQPISFTGTMSNPGGTILANTSYIKVKLTVSTNQTTPGLLANQVVGLNASYLSSNNMPLTYVGQTATTRSYEINNMPVYANQGAIDIGVGINQSFIEGFCDNSNLSFQIDVCYYNSSNSLLLQETSNVVSYTFDLQPLTCNNVTLVNATTAYNGSNAYVGQQNEYQLSIGNIDNCIEPIGNLTGSLLSLPIGVSVVSIKDGNNNSLGTATNFTIPISDIVYITLVFDCATYSVGGAVPPINVGISYNDGCGNNRNFVCSDQGQGQFLYSCCNGNPCPTSCDLLGANFYTQNYCLNNCSGGYNSNVTLTPCFANSSLNILNNVKITQVLPLYHNATSVYLPLPGSNYTISVANSGCGYASTVTGIIPATGFITLSPPSSCSSTTATTVTIDLPQVDLNSFVGSQLPSAINTSFMPNIVPNTSQYSCTLQATGIPTETKVNSVIISNCSTQVALNNMSETCNNNINTIPSSTTNQVVHKIRHRLNFNNIMNTGIDNTTGVIEIQLPNSSYIEFDQGYGIKELYVASGCQPSTSFSSNYVGGSSNYFMNNTPSHSTSTTNFAFDNINNKLIFTGVGFKDLCQNGFFDFEYQVKVKQFTPPGTYSITSTITASNVTQVAVGACNINVSEHYELGADMMARLGNGFFTNNLSITQLCNNLQFRGRITNFGNVPVTSISLFNFQPKLNDLDYSSCVSTARNSSFTIGSTNYAISSTNPSLWAPSFQNINTTGLTAGSQIPKGVSVTSNGLNNYCTNSTVLSSGGNSSIIYPNNFILQPGQTVEFYTNNNLAHNGTIGQIAKNNFSFNVVRIDNNNVEPVVLSNTSTVTVIQKNSVFACSACDSPFVTTNPCSTSGYAPIFNIMNYSSQTVTQIKIDILPTGCYPSGASFVYSGLSLNPNAIYTVNPSLNNVNGCTMQYKVTLYSPSGVLNYLDSCVGVTNSYIFPSFISAKVNLRVFLTGALLNYTSNNTTTSSIMHNKLRGSGGAFLGAYGCNNTAPATTVNYLPFTEPYTQSYTNYWQGPIGASTFPVVGEPSNETISATNMSSKNIVDWIVVELRDKNNPSIIVASKRVALLDGSIAGSNVLDNLQIGGTPTSYVDFKNTPACEYKVVVRHRNHLGIQTLNNYNTYVAPLLDFTKHTGPDVVPLYTNNTYPNLPYKIGTLNSVITRLMISGDVNSNGNVFYNTSIANSDSDALSNIVKCNLSSNSETALKYWYSSGDCMFDKMIRFNGIQNDRLFILNAYTSTVNPNYDWQGPTPVSIPLNLTLFQHIQ